jgi:hypothetical protein
MKQIRTCDEPIKNKQFDFKKEVPIVNGGKYY